jgi:hypothetical protein
MRTAHADLRLVNQWRIMSRETSEKGGKSEKGEKSWK